MSDNPQAYPCLDSSGYGLSMRDPGMTLRDYFAGQAVIGIMSTAAAFERADRRIDMVARKAYEFADAMLAERSKP